VARLRAQNARLRAALRSILKCKLIDSRVTLTIGAEIMLCCRNSSLSPWSCSQGTSRIVGLCDVSQLNRADPPNLY